MAGEWKPSPKSGVTYPVSFSPSRIQDYDFCAYYYYLKAVCKVRDAIDPKYALFGTEAHGVLETGKAPDLKLGKYLNAWNRKLEDWGDGPGTTEIHLGKLYNPRTRKYEGDPILVGGHSVAGKIDVITEKGKMGDHKFTSSPATIKHDWQSVVYPVCSSIKGIDFYEKKFHYFVFKRDKQFRFQGMIIREVILPEISEMKKRLIHILDSMARSWDTMTFPPRVSNCSKCWMSGSCPEKKRCGDLI